MTAGFKDTERNLAKSKISASLFLLKERHSPYNLYIQYPERYDGSFPLPTTLPIDAEINQVHKFSKRLFLMKYILNVIFEDDSEISLKSMCRILKLYDYHWWIAHYEYETISAHNERIEKIIKDKSYESHMLEINQLKDLLGCSCEALGIISEDN